MYKHILIATDGSDLAAKGLEQGLQLAAAMNAARPARLTCCLKAARAWPCARAGRRFALQAN